MHGIPVVSEAWLCHAKISHEHIANFQSRADQRFNDEPVHNSTELLDLVGMT